MIGCLLLNGDRQARRCSPTALESSHTPPGSLSGGLALVTAAANGGVHDVGRTHSRGDRRAVCFRARYRRQRGLRGGSGESASVMRTAREGRCSGRRREPSATGARRARTEGGMGLGGACEEPIRGTGWGTHAELRAPGRPPRPASEAFAPRLRSALLRADGHQAGVAPL